MNDSTAPRRGNGLAMFALIIAIVALFFALCTDPFKSGVGLKVPFSSGLSGYDTDTAGGMYKSQLEMRVNQDIRALIELDRRRKDKELKERLESLTIDSEADFKTKKDDEDAEYKILFIKYKNKGKERKEVASMRKDKDSGLWESGFVSDFDVEKTDKELAKKMRDWPTKQPGIGMPPPM